MKTYKVIVGRVLCHDAIFEVEATSPEEAKAKAISQAHEEEEWNLYDSEYTVRAVNET